MGLFGKKKDAGSAAPVGEAVLASGTVSIARQVDCLGDSCPRPQLMTKKALGQVDPGAVVEILVDNPSSMEALPPMCDELDATHLETVKADHCWKVYIQNA